MGAVAGGHLVASATASCGGEGGCYLRGRLRARLRGSRQRWARKRRTGKPPPPAGLAPRRRPPGSSSCWRRRCWSSTCRSPLPVRAARPGLAWPCFALLCWPLPPPLGRGRGPASLPGSLRAPGENHSLVSLRAPSLAACGLQLGRCLRLPAACCWRRLRPPSFLRLFLLLSFASGFPPGGRRGAGKARRVGLGAEGLRGGGGWSAAGVEDAGPRLRGVKKNWSSKQELIFLVLLRIFYLITSFLRLPCAFPFARVSFVCGSVASCLFLQCELLFVINSYHLQLVFSH